MAGIHVRYNVSPETFLAGLTKAVYDVVLKHGFAIPFIEVELELHNALRKVVEKDMMVSEGCGDVQCLAKAHHKIETPEAKKIFGEE